MACLLAVIVALSWPDLRLPTAPPALDRPDLLLHGLGFAVLGTLARLGWPGRRGRLFVLLAVAASALETLQLAVPGRSVSAADAVANLIGLAVALGPPGRGRRARRASSPAASHDRRRRNRPAASRR